MESHMQPNRMALAYAIRRKVILVVVGIILIAEYNRLIRAVLFKNLGSWLRMVMCAAYHKTVVKELLTIQYPITRT